MYKVFFDNMEEGFAHCKLIFDPKGRPNDWIYLRVNKNFERLTGMKDAVGKRVTEAFLRKILACVRAPARSNGAGGRIPTQIY